MTQRRECLCGSTETDHRYFGCPLEHHRLFGTDCWCGPEVTEVENDVFIRHFNLTQFFIEGMGRTTHVSQ